MSVVSVAAENPYQVWIGPGASDRMVEIVRDTARVAIIRPKDLRARADELAASVPGECITIEVPNAEKSKTWEVLASCWQLLAENGFTRSDICVGLGGGATTDLAGFVAASYLRGIRYVSMPTSLLAMVDAAVGGKTGINLPQGKNLVGAFYEPIAVLADTSMLSTLPQVECVSGLAEVIKAGLIADPGILPLVESPAVLNPGSAEQIEAIRRSVVVKAAVVAGDLRERTSTADSIGRELLNYGHTLGHAIERLEDYRWRHGEAISVGMVFAAELAYQLGLASEGFVARHRELLSGLGLPVSYLGAEWAKLREVMNLDKKTRGSTLRFVLLTDVAQPQLVVAPDEQALERAFARVSQ